MVVAVGSNNKNRVINLNPSHCNVIITSRGFTLLFFGRSQDNKTQIIIKLHLNFWWVTHLANKLWEVIKIQKRKLNTNIYHMKGGIDNDII